MTAENEQGNIPEWAREERQSDIAWIAENMPIFLKAATTAFKDGGRGAIVGTDGVHREPFQMTISKKF
jgi:hypothetical protein